MGPLDSCASCASGGAVRAISPDLGKSSISEMAQSLGRRLVVCEDGAGVGLLVGAKVG